jgi:hypothetical protein
MSRSFDEKRIELIEQALFQFSQLMELEPYPHPLEEYRTARLQLEKDIYDKDLFADPTWLSKEIT